MTIMRRPRAAALAVGLAAIAFAVLSAHAGGAGESTRTTLTPTVRKAPPPAPPAPPAPPTRRAPPAPPAPPAPAPVAPGARAAQPSPCMRELDIRGRTGRDQVWITRIAVAGTPDAVYRRIAGPATDAAPSAGLVADTADVQTRTMLFIEAPDVLPAGVDRGLLTLQVSVLPLEAHAMIEFRMRVPQGMAGHRLLAPSSFCAHAERVMAARRP